jgi:hypothetical protein
VSSPKLVRIPELRQRRFRWVSLQIDNLCDPGRIKHEKDVEQELGHLPRSLEDSYQVIHQRIKTSGPVSKSIADRAIAWLLCAKYSLRSSAFIAAVSVDLEGNSHKISRRDLLNMCCNLVVWDEVIDCFRFAHLSVQEYFHSQVEYNTTRVNEMASTRCVNVFISEASLKPNSEGQLRHEAVGDSNFRTYAIRHWHHHCNNAGNPICNKTWGFGITWELL